MSWEGPDRPRDEDRYYEDASMVPAALLGPEIGSESWVRNEIAAGRSGDERDVFPLSTGSHRGASPRSSLSAELSGVSARMSARDLLAEVRSTTSAIGPDGRSIYFDDLVCDGQIVWVYGDRRSDEVRRRMVVRFDPAALDWFAEDAS